MISVYYMMSVYDNAADEITSETGAEGLTLHGSHAVTDLSSDAESSVAPSSSVHAGPTGGIAISINAGSDAFAVYAGELIEYRVTSAQKTKARGSVGWVKVLTVDAELASQGAYPLLAHSKHADCLSLAGNAYCGGVAFNPCTFCANAQHACVSCRHASHASTGIFEHKDGVWDASQYTKRAVS
jgi:hypothetical protein